MSKKILLFFGSLLLATIFAFAADDCNDALSGNAQKVRISNDGKPKTTETKPHPKSVTVDEVECWLDSDEGMIELMFNKPIGIATVTVATAAGTTLYQTQCDTATASYIVLPAPAQSGAYTITVTSATFDGSGFFTI